MFAYENKRVMLNSDIDKLNVINFLHASCLLETRELTKTYKLKFNRVRVKKEKRPRHDHSVIYVLRGI